MRNVEISMELYDKLVDIFYEETCAETATYGEIDEYITPIANAAISEYLDKRSK